MPSGELDLARLVFEMEESLVPVIAKIDLPNLKLDRVNVRLIKDQVSEVPLWVAEILESMEVAIIQEDQKVSHGYLARLAHKEGEDRTLKPIDSHLYRRVRIEIDRLDNINTSTSLRRKTSLEGSFQKLLRRRFKKLLNIVMIDNQLDGNLPLTEEEKWLYQELNKVFSTWQSRVGLDSDNI
ncbi:MAG: hypothetical protein INQ03_15115 [Candidatus Heimdallarchaeota archaeon]|nr:hypothetical protein [Candidatus Heimdallarchaeota archaeon]